LPEKSSDLIVELGVKPSNNDERKRTDIKDALEKYKSVGELMDAEPEMYCKYR